MTEQKSSKVDYQADINKESRQLVNPEHAIKNMKWIVFGFIVIAITVAFIIQIIVKEPNDLTNAVTLSVEIIFGIFIALVVYVYSKRMHDENKKIQTTTEKRIEKVVEQTANEIVQKVVDIANAQLRVKDGGKITLRKEGNVGADIVRNVSEGISIGENVVAVLERGSTTKVISENQVQHFTDTVVAENKKTFTVDALLITQEQQIKNIKKELAETRKLYSKLYSKKQKSRKRRKKSKSKK